MRIISSVEEFLVWRKSCEEPIGFVPTMGALHEGHQSLFLTAVNENPVVVASIFVNPTQFNDPKDLEKYPRTLEKDIEMLSNSGVHILFLPESTEIYRDGYQYKIVESDLSTKLCGAFRPGHFDGVLTVVLKLLNIVQPRKAYFGEKDYQQLKLIEGMVKAFFMPIEVQACATIRESSGLAMSSRNKLLTEDELRLAPRLYGILKVEKDLTTARQKLESLGFKFDYVEDIGGRRFVAARLGSVRLIDNWEMSL